MSITEKLLDGLRYTKSVLNGLPVTGAANCQLVANAVLNIDVFFACVERGEVTLTDKEIGEVEQ